MALAINGTKLTGRVFKAAIAKYLAHRCTVKAQKDVIPHGKQTVKQLVRQGAGVQNIEITEKNIKSFERVARKYGVDFALKRDKAAGKYLVFFKGRDADALNAAFSEFSDKTLHQRRREKPSILAQLKRIREAAKNQTRAVIQHLNKGGMEL